MRCPGWRRTSAMAAGAPRSQRRGPCTSYAAAFRRPHQCRPGRLTRRRRSAGGVARRPVVAFVSGCRRRAPKCDSDGAPAGIGRPAGGTYAAPQLRARHAERKPARPLAAGAGRFAGHGDLRPTGHACLVSGVTHEAFSPRAVVALGVVARGAHSAGSVEVAAAARSWETLSAPVRVSWFPARTYPQLLADPTRLPSFLPPVG